MVTEFNRQGPIAEETILQQLNQGVCTDSLSRFFGMLYYHPCLSAAADGYFLFSRNAKHSSKQMKNIMNEIKESDKNINKNKSLVKRQRLQKKLKLLSVLCLMIYSTCAFAQTANPQQYKYVFTVAKDGSGDYKYIQDAIDAMRGFTLAPITLYIKNGVYNEKIELNETKVDITFIGENVDSTIIVFNDYSGRGKLTTFTSYTAKISGNRFVAENITFKNNAGRVGQAVAMYVDADKVVFKNCKFLGDQDTIFASGETSRQYFKNCYIEGTTDFIFGPATALFDDCIIHAKTNSFITAANTPKDRNFGFVFLNCTITADSSVTAEYLGRPWRAYAKTVFINCTLPKQIIAAGWHNWDNPENEKTVFYAEYKSKGEGAGVSERVKWSRQLTDAEAKTYTPDNILGDTDETVPGESDWYNVKSRPFAWPAK